MLELLLLLTSAVLLLNIVIFTKLLPRQKTHKGKIMLLDTSALMDGRIIEVIRSGFVPAQLLIPRFVIAELQLLADKADHLKRERARFGLQVIQDLQESRNAEVKIIDDDIAEEKGVDEKLVKLSLKLDALLFTTDFNLLKVAEIEGIRVLNINALAQNLRPMHVPGETTDIKIVGKGQERTQGVGYLQDGTLVVVENAGKLLNKTVPVEFTRNLQTTAGRMMFAKPVNKTIPDQNYNKKSTATTSRRKNTKTNLKNLHRPKTQEDKLLEAIEKQGYRQKRGGF